MLLLIIYKLWMSSNNKCYFLSTFYINYFYVDRYKSFETLYINQLIINLCLKTTFLTIIYQ